MNELLELRGITAGYEQTVVLRGVNLTIREHDFIGIIGPNGGGKTTLLKVILGLLPPVSGVIRFYEDGRSVPSLRIAKQSLFGYLPQNSRFDARFPISVKEVVLSGLMSEKGIFKSYTKADREKADELLETYGMGEFGNRPIGELSGGQMQRVFLCRAIISSPKILILDEPSTYVDANFENEFYAVLGELNKTMSIVMVSHDLGTICSYVKTIACVNGGLHYHESNLITPEQLKLYNCPIELISHGTVPHRVLLKHDGTNEN